MRCLCQIPPLAALETPWKRRQERSVGAREDEGYQENNILHQLNKAHLNSGRWKQLAWGRQGSAQR